MLVCAMEELSIVAADGKREVAIRMGRTLEEDGQTFMHWRHCMRIAYHT